MNETPELDVTRSGVLSVLTELLKLSWNSRDAGAFPEERGALGAAMVLINTLYFETGHDHQCECDPGNGTEGDDHYPGGPEVGGNSGGLKL